MSADSLARHEKSAAYSIYPPPPQINTSINTMMNMPHPDIAMAAMRSGRSSCKAGCPRSLRTSFGRLLHRHVWFPSHRWATPEE